MYSIGNIVEIEGEVSVVKSVSVEGNTMLINGMDSDLIKPIRLSDIWLLFLNFGENNGNSSKYSMLAASLKDANTRFDFDYCLKDNLFSFKSRWKGNDELIFLPHIKYVHQVQNLHYYLVENLITMQSIKK